MAKDSTRDAVFLVPGFFGFTEIGTLSYFVGVRTALTEALKKQGIEVTVHSVKTQPTGSLRKRAERLYEIVAEAAPDPDQRLHFVGHSTGGLDARLVVSPGVHLRDEALIEETIGRRTRSVITVSTPHWGTPLADFFTTAFGKQILYALSALTTTQARRAAVAAGAQLTVLVASIAESFGYQPERLHYLTDRVLSRMSGAPEDALWAWLREVREDQGALLQLTAEAADLFNATISDREGVDYACVCTASPPPRDVETSLLRPLDQGLYRLIWNVTSRPHRGYAYPAPSQALLDRWAPTLPFPLDARANDGIVPTLAQVHGRVLDVVLADHLDIVGQYDRELEGARHVNWLHSGAHFDDKRFEATWTHVADAIAANIIGPGKARRAPAPVASA